MNIAVVSLLAACAAILYVLAAYPIGLAFYARWHNKPVRKEFKTTHEVTFVIPVRNGARWILQKIHSIESLDYPTDHIQVLILSDGSTDETAALVRSYVGQLRVRLLEYPAQGKAATLNRGLKEVTTDLVILTDVRQEFDRGALRHLLAPFADPSVGVVTGELVIRTGATSEEVNTGLYWRYEKWIRGNLNRIDAMLGATGAIYAIKRALIRSMPAGTLLDDVFLPLAAASAGQRIYFEFNAKVFDFPTSLQSEFRRKVRTQAGIYQIMRQFPSLFWPGNQRFVHFLSHKTGRLMLPFFLIVVAVSSCFLPTPFNALLLIPQALFYGAAVIDPYVSEASPLKRITAVIRAFLVLVAAAMCAISVFFLPAQALWKDTKVSLSRTS